MAIGATRHCHPAPPGVLGQGVRERSYAPDDRPLTSVVLVRRTLPRPRHLGPQSMSMLL